MRGVVTVDSPVDVRPFAQLVRSMAPALRGPGFADAFAQFERSMGLDLVPEPQRSAALDTHKVSREVVLGYWDELLRSDAEEVQARVTENAGRIDAPCLAVFGHELSGEARDHLRRLVARVQVEEWPGLGHFVHLADADRFAARLEVFVDFCDSVGSVR